MEENKEKKRHGRRRHYRGKNPDKAGEQNKEAGAEKKAENEKPAKQDRNSRHVRQERRPRHEDKIPVKQEIQEDDAAEDKNVKPRREPIEPVFEFTWADAWGLYGTGYHVVIKDNQDKLYLSWSVDLSYGELKIGQRLQEFLDDMKTCGIGKWDGHRYTKAGIFDGDTWAVKVNSLTLKSEAQGSNEYPQEWKTFLKCLHDKWHIPVSKREQWE